MKIFVRFVAVSIVIGVCVGILYFMGQSKDKGTEGVLKQLFSGSQEPSPYSLSWGTLLVCVVDQQGTPVADAKVTLAAKLPKNCDGDPTEEAPAWHCTSVETNEKGEFAIPQDVWNNDEEKKTPHDRLH